MTRTSEPTRWQAVVGSARGAVHDLRGMPNQDSAGSLDLATPPGTVVAVADGHGHDRHFRSAAGSRLAVATACRVAGQLAAELAAGGWTGVQAAALRDRLPETMVAAWLKEVACDLAANPYTAGELAALEEAGDGPVIPYGSTLLVAVAAGGWLVCAQIGDGDLLGVRPDGGTWDPVEGDEVLDGYRTTSLCQPGAASSFRTSARDLRAQPLAAVLLGTDGYGNAQASDPWQPEVARDLAKLTAARSGDWFAEQVPHWAEHCASQKGSGDDTTIALLLAPDRAEHAGAAKATPVSHQDFVPARRRFTRHHQLIAAASAVFIALAIVIGLLASQSPGFGISPSRRSSHSPHNPAHATAPLATRSAARRPGPVMIPRPETRLLEPREIPAPRPRPIGGRADRVTESGGWTS